MVMEIDGNAKVRYIAEKEDAEIVMEPLPQIRAKLSRIKQK